MVSGIILPNNGTGFALASAVLSKKCIAGIVRMTVDAMSLLGFASGRATIVHVGHVWDSLKVALADAMLELAHPY